MTFSETHCADRYSFFLRLWNEDGDQMDLEYCDTEHEAAMQLDKLEYDVDSVVNRGGKWTHFDLVRMDWLNHYEEVIDGGDF